MGPRRLGATVLNLAVAYHQTFLLRGGERIQENETGRSWQHLGLAGFFLPENVFSAIRLIYDFTKNPGGKEEGAMKLFRGGPSVVECAMLAAIIVVGIMAVILPLSLGEKRGETASIKDLVQNPQRWKGQIWVDGYIVGCCFAESESSAWYLLSEAAGLKEENPKIIVFIIDEGRKPPLNRHLRIRGEWHGNQLKADLFIEIYIPPGS